MRKYFSVEDIDSIQGRKIALEAVDAELAQWFLGLPPNLRSNSSQQADTTDPNPQLLQLTYNAILIQFHRLLTKGGGK